MKREYEVTAKIRVTVDINVPIAKDLPAYEYNGEIFDYNGMMEAIVDDYIQSSEVTVDAYFASLDIDATHQARVSSEVWNPIVPVMPGKTGQMLLEASHN
ncbi:MAG: hypothetical protein F6K54_01515 [Okeania sp. SIO3B5]|uniref:hypothetical protein n=1 Tax=Okeania sp. SIO3B5 TaxID=2607811 RepID=UPI0013FFBFE7|nr:hypothetical protein [Okeania sp. SIO3B5]NEO51880.1 hypothetical protein [Okeania sp. SIO3B5]